jgi:hypothetical protein
VIDADAKGALDKHLERLKHEAKVLHALPPPTAGTFFAPVLAEIPAADFLEREVFGPVLHVVRYAPEDLEQVAGALAARRYGLTLGIHSRIEASRPTSSAWSRPATLRQPLDDRRRGRRAAVRRRRPVGHRPQGRRPPRPAASVRRNPLISRGASPHVKVSVIKKAGGGWPASLTKH